MKGNNSHLAAWEKAELKKRKVRKRKCMLCERRCELKLIGWNMIHTNNLLIFSNNNVWNEEHNIVIKHGSSWRWRWWKVAEPWRRWIAVGFRWRRRRCKLIWNVFYIRDVIRDYYVKLYILMIVNKCGNVYYSVFIVEW